MDVVLVFVALVDVMDVGVMFMLIAFVNVMHMPRLVAVVLVVVALVNVVYVSVMFVAVALVDVVGSYHDVLTPSLGLPAGAGVSISPFDVISDTNECQ